MMSMIIGAVILTLVIQYLKPNGVLKVVIPYDESRHDSLKEFFIQDLKLGVLDQSLPHRYLYKPLSASRPFLECFFVLQKCEASGNSLSKAVISTISVQSLRSGSCIDEISSRNSRLALALKDFVASQGLAYKLMQTIWLKGCRVAALLIKEATLQTSRQSDVEIFHNRVVL